MLDPNIHQHLFFEKHMLVLHYDVVCTYCDGARHCDESKAWTISCPTVVVAPSNFYSGRPVAQIEIRDQNHEKFEIFKNVENFALNAI